MKKLIFPILILSLIFSSTMISKADIATSSSSFVTVYGHDYEYFSSVTVHSGTVWAHVNIKSNEYENLPAGYMGAYARLYNSSGSLISSSGWTYNNTVCAGISNMTPIYYTNNGTYYGRGQVKMYNGNGYNLYNSTRSPNLQAYALFDSEDFYDVNDNGEIYGSELLLEQFNIYPDLIQTIGNNGNLGYVKSTDLNDTPINTLDDALEYQNNLQTHRTIIVYECDGITPIDTFTIGYECEEIMLN
ncbi:MAG: hypothetical protein J6B98_05395 [Bacilli bacterium]|nr:hypothetical protein [Bacilli bacterium]